jgi:hypothetical protein
MKNYKSLFFLFIFLICNLAYGANTGKYCNAKGIKYDVHIFGYTFKDDNGQKMMARGLTELFKRLQTGDHIKIFVHNPSGYTVPIDQCVPGCPEESFIKSMVDSSCSVQVAKRDRVAFDQLYAKSALSTLNRTGQSYDIFQAIQNLSDVYRGQKDQGTVIAAISMVPDGVNPINKSDFDKYYVTKVPGLQLTTDFPSLLVIGGSSSKQVLDFWYDVFVKLKKVKFDMKEFN